ncbi:MAG: hypothetical protein RMK20_08370, partial [Verrucomicrobiales bacterium]|nr:hypothetical protein [Verrucomicrobiales bacterium]
PADAEGRRRQDAFSYYTNGPMAGYLATARYDNGGLNLTSTFEYDARGNLTRCITPRGHDILWTYNALDQLVQAQSPPAGGGQRITTRLFYDANDNLVQVDRENRDATGALHPTNPWWTSFATFDALDRPVLICDEIAHSTFSGTTFLTNRLSWDANDNLARIEGPRAVSGQDPNQQTLLTYDERGLLHTLVEAPGTSVGCTNTFAYDKKRGKILRIENGKVEVENISNRHRQLPASHTNFMGSVWFFTYDRNDNLIRARFFGETNDVPGSANNIRLAETRWEYDALNRCVRQRDSFFDIFTGLPISDGESTHTFTYAPNGQLISETDDLGRTIRYTYDTAGRLTAITDPATNRIEFSYDANGNVTQVRQVDRSDLGGPEQVFLLNASYDPCDRLISETDNLGNALQFAYDSLDNVVRVTDPRGNDSCYEYDGLSRLLTARHFAGPCGGALIGSARCDYQDTRLVAFTDGNSNVTRYAYDSLDRCVAVTNADLTVHTVFFDGSGALRWVRDANGTVVSNTVDALNRVIRRDIFPGPTVAPTTTFETFVWDGRSFLMRASNNLSRCTFTWDSLGNCRAATQDGFALSQLSDSLGNSLSLTLPSGRVLGASYDALDRPTALTFQAGGAPTTLATLAYEGPDRLGRIARPNGIHTRLHWNGTLTPPNAPGDFGWQQVVRVNHQFAGGGTIIDQRAYAYDRSQNKTRRAQVAPFTPGGPLQTNLWVADALDRLVQSDTFRGNVWETTRTYQLDPNGNRQIVTENGVAQPYTLDPTLPEPADFQMNQYTTSPFGEYLYDPNGNRNAAQIAQGDFLFTYDYADRLVQVERLTGGVPETLFTYTYDALGRRLSRTFHPPTPLAPQTTTYIYHPDDDSVVEEWRDGALHRTHVVGRGREIRKTLPVAVRAEVSASGQVRHVLCDELGNALALTDAAGNVLERYDYDDSGQPRFLDPNGNPLLDGGGQPVSASPAGLDWLYRGAYWNATLGLHEAVAVGDCDLPEDFDPLNAAPLTGMKIEGGMPNRIMMNVSAGRQTSGATFGGRVILGLQQPDNAPPSDSVRGRTAHNVISHLKQMLVTPMRMSGGGRLLDEGEAGDNVGLLLRQNNNPPKPPPKPTTTKPKEFKGHITLLK